MAHFIGFVKGSRGDASRLGTKQSGLKVRANGWDIGAEVEVSHKDGQDYVTVFITRGSHAAGGVKYVGTFRLDGQEIVNA